MLTNIYKSSIKALYLPSTELHMLRIHPLLLLLLKIILNFKLIHSTKKVWCFSRIYFITSPKENLPQVSPWIPKKFASFFKEENFYSIPAISTRINKIEIAVLFPALLFAIPNEGLFHLAFLPNFTLYFQEYPTFTSITQSRNPPETDRTRRAAFTSTTFGGHGDTATLNQVRPWAGRGAPPINFIGAFEPDRPTERKVKYALYLYSQIGLIYTPNNSQVHRFIADKNISTRYTPRYK